MSLTFKQDQYVINRKGYSEFFDLKCSKCHNHIAYYQKDGPGPLLRVYDDRLQLEEEQIFKEGDLLKCPKCQKMLGLASIYEKEKRPAYALFQNTVIKKPCCWFRHLKCLVLSVFR